MIFFVGPQKAGTSWVDAYLRWHGGVALPEDLKETMFFDKFYDNGLPWYVKFYTNAEPDHTRVEVAPTYFASAEARQRIKEYAPKSSIVVSVRDPAKRTFSSYLHEQRYGFIPAHVGFRKAVEEQNLEDASRYYEHTTAWQQAFGAERIHFLHLTSMKDLDDYARQICTIAGIEFKPVPDELRGRVNEASVPRSYGVASLVSKLNQLSRKLGLLKFRKWLIGLGLKKLIYSGGGDGPASLSVADREWLMEHYLGDDWARFQQEFPHGQS
ncbi:sulfotransferase [Lewinella sp. 4G2]|uniref:sulfotransferase family protein n=1 Tax=Lewinella sp. 4G2 TaxID=1803372 RepID=UPI0007B4E89C|nr:sulfotransferase [Lewinella sp. 4G2]OAV44308.1 hypothetical protein A3850_007290 [Lewinella sp. 4G2]